MVRKKPRLQYPDLRSWNQNATQTNLGWYRTQTPTDPWKMHVFWGVFLLTWMFLLFFKWHGGTQYTMLMNSTVGGRNPAITSWGNGSWNPLIYRGFKNIPGGDRRFLPATVPQTPGFEILNHICIFGYLGSVSVGVFLEGLMEIYRNFERGSGGIYQVGMGGRIQVFR